MAKGGKSGEGGDGYEDIMHLPHHISSIHPPMSRTDRAAQFSPFAALTGYHAAIEETERLTDVRAELDEDEKKALNEKLRMLQEKIAGCPEAAITYFQPDNRKEGGAYVTAIGNVRRIDMYERTVIMKDGTKIPIDEIAGIAGD